MTIRTRLLPVLLSCTAMAAALFFPYLFPSLWMLFLITPLFALACKDKLARRWRELQIRCSLAAASA